MRRRRPNIAIGLYAFAPGGGEMLPIALANGLKKLGYPVCVYDFAAEERNARIRSRLSASIPVFAARDIYNFVHDNGLDISIPIIAGLMPGLPGQDYIQIHSGTLLPCTACMS